jgi:hypothetical protein
VQVRVELGVVDEEVAEHDRVERDAALGPADAHRGAAGARRGQPLVPHHRLLGDRVDGEAEPVQGAAGLDLDQAGRAVEGEGHGEDGLERVALGAAGRADVGLAGADPDGEVEDVRDDIAGDAWPLVRDLEHRSVEADVDHGRKVGRLGGVEAVVDELLERDLGPLVRRVADLGGELARGGEVEEARGAVDLPLGPRAVTGPRGDGCRGAVDGGAHSSSSPLIVSSASSASASGEKVFSARRSASAA